VKLKKATEEISEITRCKKKKEQECERNPKPEQKETRKHNRKTKQHSWKIVEVYKHKRKEGRQKFAENIQDRRHKSKT